MLLCTKIHVSLDTMATNGTNMFFSQLNPSVSDFTGIGCRVKLRARVEAMESRLRARLVELNYLRMCEFCGFELLSYYYYRSSSTIIFYQKPDQVLLEPRGCCPMRGGRAGTPVCRYYLENDSDHLSKIQVMKAKVEESISQLARYKEMLNFMTKI